MAKRNIPSLEKRKEQYDLFLKDFENRPEVFRKDYPVYFKDLESAGISGMSKEDKDAYDSGAGGELKEHNNKKGIVFPPPMLSVASSSRFCYLSLVDSDLSVFDIKKGDSKIRFEEKLPILNRGTPPHMDAYLETESDVYFFECKCHEQFDAHKLNISKSYLNKGLIVDEFVDDNGAIFKTKLGIEDNPRFDFKQLLTHIMGIQKRMEITKNKKATLIYYYFIPNGVLGNTLIKEVIDKLECEIKIIFSKIKDYIPDITLRFYVQYSKVVETADEDNTESRL